MTHELNTDTGNDTDTIPAGTDPNMQIHLANTALQAANALEKIAGHPLEAATIDKLNEAHAGLLDTSTAGLMPSPARLLALFEVMAIDLISASASTTNASAKSELMRTALAASKEVRELVGLLRGLKAEAREVEGRDSGVGVGVSAG